MNGSQSLCASKMLCSAAFFRRPWTHWKPFSDLLQVRWSSSSWQVSSHGRVQNSKGQISFGCLHSSGYRGVQIEGGNYMVHRLVAGAFLGAPVDRSCWQVNHLDCDRENNHVENLQYASHSENQKHAYAVNLNRKPGRRTAVLWRPRESEFWSYCHSQADAARLLGLSASCVSQCCRGVVMTTRSFGIWYDIKAARASQTPPLLPGEVWQPARYPGIPGPIENLMVSNYGRVSQVRSRTGGISRGTRLRDGYHLVLRAGRGLLVHRLVAATFLGEPDSLDKQVNHKDSDRGNNRMDNLEYVTQSENMKHAWQRRSGNMRSTRNGIAVQGRPVHCDSSGVSWLSFDTMVRAATYTGVCQKTVSRICRGLDSSIRCKWEFRFAAQEQIEGEEWRPVVLKEARRPMN